MSSHYKVVGRTSYNFVTAGHVEYYAYYHITNLHIQLVQNAPDDGLVRSETCRANIRDEQTHSLKHLMYLAGLHIYYKMIQGPYNIKLTALNT